MVHCEVLSLPSSKLLSLHFVIFQIRIYLCGFVAPWRAWSRRVEHYILEGVIALCFWLFETTTIELAVENIVGVTATGCCIYSP